MPKLSMADMESTPPSEGVKVHLALLQAKQDRLLMKEQRLAKTEERLENQRKDALKKERQKRSAEAEARAQDGRRAAEMERRAHAEIDLRFDVVYAIEAAAQVVGMPVSDQQSKFLVELMVQLRRAKII